MARSMKYALSVFAVLILSACGGATVKQKYDLVELFEKKNWKNSGAYFWDDLKRQSPPWKDLQYQWIGSSTYGDQIILTENSPLHEGPAIYVHGPDIAGPKSDKKGWHESILYLGNSVEEWHARIRKYGDEHSIGPGGIEREVKSPEEYRAIYRKLNPGISW